MTRNVIRKIKIKNEGTNEEIEEEREGERKEEREEGRKTKVDPSYQNAEHFNLVSLVQLFS